MLTLDLYRTRHIAKKHNPNYHKIINLGDNRGFVALNSEQEYANFKYSEWKEGARISK